jgi:hypothetical protein
VLIVLAPVATAVDMVAGSAATIATSVAGNVTSSIISTTNIHNPPSDNGGIASTDIASTIASWTSLSSSIATAAGKTVTLTLSTPFDMTGFQCCASVIHIDTAHTAITIVGNGAVFDARGQQNFFFVRQSLVMSNVTLQNGVFDPLSMTGGAIVVLGDTATATLSNCIFSNNTANGANGGGAISVFQGIVTLSNCIFSGNTAPGGSVYGGVGGAIYVGGWSENDASATLSNCIFSRNTVTGQIGDAPGSGGGALFFLPNSTGLLKNCSLLGTVSPKNNNIARHDTTANVTFACADGEVGTPVQMSGTEITKLPVPTCTTSYSCDSLTGICKSDKSGAFPSKQACSSGCTAQPTPAPCQVPRNCGDKVSGLQV